MKFHIDEFPWMLLQLLQPKFAQPRSVQCYLSFGDRAGLICISGVSKRTEEVSTKSISSKKANDAMGPPVNDGCLVILT